MQRKFKAIDWCSILLGTKWFKRSSATSIYHWTSMKSLMFSETEDFSSFKNSRKLKHRLEIERSLMVNLGIVYNALFFFISVFLASKLSTPIALFCAKWSEKHLFLSVHIASFLWKPLLTIGAFTKHLFFAFTMIKCVLKNLRFCEYPLLIASLKTFPRVGFLCASD